MPTGLKANVDGSAALQVGGTDYLTVTSGGNTTFTQAANLPNTFGFKNRIINGAMVIDQRALGTVTVNSSGLYTVDRWQANQTATGKFSVGKSTVAPAGFTNSYLATSLSAYSVSSSDIFFFAQQIEGFNTADLGWGTASAQAVTLSFWVRSSLTGTFGGVLTNSAGNRSYPYTYTISAANTWEQKSVTIAGDTTGTWLTDNGIGISVIFALGGGSTRSGTAGSWQAANLYTATGATSVVGTNGATFYITGVQLEKGSTATSFDFRSIGTELSLCQRYLPAWQFANSSTNIANTFVYSSLTAGPFQLINPVAVRTPVTGLTVSAAGNFSVSDGDSSTACNAITFSSGSTMITGCTWGTGSNRTAFRPHYLFTNTTNASILGAGCEL